ncbi:MAG: peptide-binding protein [Elusimicrobia bacterium]|nr:peptide-binding protein [Candidatus Liberimonas magnetica]
MKHLTALILLFCLLSGFIACKKNSIQYGKTNTSTPEYGDFYITSSIGDASYLNPVLATDSASGNINGLIYNGLVKYDKNITLVGDLAEKWSVSKNGLVLTFYLRKNVLWHDGRPFTAEDVKFTYERLIDPAVKTPYSSDYLIIKEFKIINPYSIVITYKKPFAPALESWGMGIIPKHIFKEGDFNSHPANRNPVGTGPYRFKEWKTDEKIVLEPNANYFEGKPFLNRYISKVIPDQAVEFLELRNQNIDEMSLTPDQWKAYPEFFENYTKFRYPSFAYTYLAFNLANPAFQDKKFRQAIAHAINKDDIINGVLLGMGKAATGPFIPESWAYNKRVRDYSFDVKESKRLLNELGWKVTNKNSYLEKDGKILEFTILTNQGNKLRSLTAEIIQAQLKKIGIKVNIRIIEWSSLLHEFIDKRNFEAVILGWSLGRDPDQFSIWHSSQKNDGQYNFVSYANPQVDRLLELGRTVFDIGKRKEIYNKLHEILAGDLPYIFLYYPESLVVVHKRFRGPEVSPIGLGWNFYKWWAPKNEQKYMLN